MRKTLRSALICMLMLALPAQAMAALGMQLCEQVHRSSMMQNAVDEHGGHQDMAAAVDHSAHHASQGADVGDTANADDGLCTLCAFCVGAAAPGQPFSNPSALHAAEPSQAWPDRFVAAILDTPERPPRISLA